LSANHHLPLFLGTRVEHLNALKLDVKSRFAEAGSLRQAQNKFEPRLKSSGISLSLNLLLGPNPADIAQIKKVEV